MTEQQLPVARFKAGQVSAAIWQNKAQKILATPLAQLTEEWVRVEEKKAA